MAMGPVRSVSIVIVPCSLTTPQMSWTVRLFGVGSSKKSPCRLSHRRSKPSSNARPSVCILIGFAWLNSTLTKRCVISSPALQPQTKDLPKS